MRRADRLFRIVQHLRGGRLTTAARLAEAMEVSERTIYRDIADLQASGVPVDGEAGVGYVLRQGFLLPPLMFSEDEIVALVAGARLIRAWGGAQMAAAAEEALVKIAAVLPEGPRARAEAVRIHAIAPEMTGDLAARLDRIEAAIDTRCCLEFDYADAAGLASRREVEPLVLLFWGKVWTLAAWCRLRQDFRVFRVDRIAGMCEGVQFRPDPARSLTAFLRLKGRELP